MAKTRLKSADHNVCGIWKHMTSFQICNGGWGGYVGWGGWVGGGGG